MSKRKDLLSPGEGQGEKLEESGLRPRRLDDFVGQERLKRHLRIYLSAAKARSECLDHVLLYGPPGLGKTTMAYVIAEELGSKIRPVSAPSMEKPGDLAVVLSELEPGDVLFVDEIHRLPRPVEEILYSAMEDFVLQIMVNRDGIARAIRVELPPFTLVGATTKSGGLSSPLRARFGIQEKIDYYPVAEIDRLLDRTSRVLEVSIADDARFLIAARSRGTPRIANRLFRRVRDFASYEGKETIDLDTCAKALASLGVDELGLDEIDIAYLSVLINRFGGGPTGLEAIASAIGEDPVDLESVHEPYLVRTSLVDRTPRGRVAGKKAIEYLKGSKGPP